MSRVGISIYGDYVIDYLVKRLTVSVSIVLKVRLTRLFSIETMSVLVRNRLIMLCCCVLSVCPRLTLCWCLSMPVSTTPTTLTLLISSEMLVTEVTIMAKTCRARRRR